MSGFWVKAKFFVKVHRMTPNDLDMVKVKNTNMHVTYSPEIEIFVRFALRWAVFELWPNFRKSAPNDPKWPWHLQGQNTYTHATYTSETQIFILSLYDELFLIYGPIFGKVHQMTPNDLDIFKIKNTNMHVTYTPEAQISVSFALRWAVFELWLNF